MFRESNTQRKPERAAEHSFGVREETSCLPLLQEQGITTYQTLTYDHDLGVPDRLDRSNQFQPDAVVTIHHDQGILPVCTTAGIYDDGQAYLAYWSVRLAADLSMKTKESLGTQTTDAGAKTEGEFYDGFGPPPQVGNLLNPIANPHPAAAINAFSVPCGPTAECDPQSDVTYLEAYGIRAGTYLYLVTVSVGNTFHATGNSGSVTLTWSESYPSREVDYILERSDSCWGPYVWLANVSSNGSTNYTYVDNTVAFAREFSYRLTVTGEVGITSAAPTGLPAATPPGTPSNLATLIDLNGTVRLEWDAPSGSVTGYRILRSQYNPLDACTNVDHIVATTTAAAYTDATAPHGVELYYRVLAYNGTGSSGVSGQASCSVTTDAHQDEADLRLTPKLSVQANLS